ncbi:hypothetical protein J2793_000905 [Paraburkholderia caledonica]|uniref:Uncharacterized protein n=1 Tax=Paraburkholderia caledonica TaxID=134536 RepID=A0AB73I647_9BURK|nr:hypothetical protein [Paraburkholderia caledonica]MDR7006671.1 hypothetical protein [Paraburkholderia strydomiana]
MACGKRAYRGIRALIGMSQACIAPACDARRFHNQKPLETYSNH